VTCDWVKGQLHEELRSARAALLWKLDGLPEYDIRRPLTVTGTNLLGLIKHLATWEARYFGAVFGRPFPEPLPHWDDRSARGSDLWVTKDETREHITGLYQGAQRHADATITALPLDAPGHVPWWPRPEVTLLAIMIQVLSDTTRHAGHADILREQLDGRTGIAAWDQRPADPAAREARYAKIEQAAKQPTDFELLCVVVTVDKVNRPHNLRDNRAPPDHGEEADGAR